VTRLPRFSSVVVRPAIGGTRPLWPPITRSIASSKARAAALTGAGRPPSTCCGAVFDALAVKVDQQSVIIDGDSVAQVLSIEGKDVGDFLGLLPTGKSFRVPGVFLYDLKDGLIARERRIYDFTALLIQIGLLKAKPAD
jgi:hypothetical protein